MNATDRERWIVDVVLRANGREDDEDAVVAAVADGQAHREEGFPRQTASYDVPPPDGSLGVSCLLRATGAGDAVDQAIALVSAAATTVTGMSHAVWDVRALPESAVLTRKDYAQTDDKPGGWERLRR